MAMALNISAWAIHMLALAGVILFYCKQQKIEWRDWPFVLFVILWADLVLASQLTSLCGLLGKLWAYIPATFIGLAIMLLSHYALRERTQPLMTAPSLTFTPIDNKSARKFLWWALALSLGIVALLNLVVVIGSNPDNADSIIYRLPRAFWYVSQGSFMHPFPDAIDKRLVFYPLDGISLYISFVLYQLPGVAHNFPSIFMWLAIGYATYRFARTLGAERLIGFFSAWLVMMTPNIMAQAISTNDEILTAAALLVGLYMGLRWLMNGDRTAFFLAVISVSISIGTKLHIVFLAPVLFIALCIAAWHFTRKPEEMRLWGRAIGWRAAAFSLIFALIMIVPFLFYNYASVGRWYFFDDFKHDVFNWRGSLHGFLQNLLIYTAQMTLAPIADLNVWPNANDRQIFNNALNDLTNPLIKPFIDTNDNFYHMSYRFGGVTIPTSVRFVEFSLWAGFVWLLWPLTIGLWSRCKQTFTARPYFILIAATPLLWLFFWSATTLYMEGTATYFSYYLAVSAPAICAVFLPIRRALWNELRWLVIAFVALSSFVIVGNIFAYSGFRSVTDIVRGSHWPFDWQLFDPAVPAEIKRADRIRIVYMHEKMPYFGFMRWNPAAKYLDPYRMPPDNFTDILQIIPVSSLNTYGFMPIKLTEKPSPGLTFLGLMRGIGREAVFGIGNGVEKRYPKENSYILFQILSTKNNAGTYTVRTATQQPVGVNQGDALEYRFEIASLPEGQRYVREWSADGAFAQDVQDDPTVYLHGVTITVRDAVTQKILGKQSYQLGGPGAWLPDGPEY